MNTTTESSTFYIVHIEYVGPDFDTDRYIDADTLEIWTTPARKNQSGEECTEGWCGTNGDFSTTAYGEYDSLEEARAVIEDRWNTRLWWTRERCEVFRNGEILPEKGYLFDERDGFFQGDEDTTVEKYKLGKLAPMTTEAVGNLMYETLERDITSTTTDEEIETLAKEIADEWANLGWEWHGDLAEMMREERQEKIEEYEE